jgi:hypothetical protein
MFRMESDRKIGNVSKIDYKQTRERQEKDRKETGGTPEMDRKQNRERPENINTRPSSAKYNARTLQDQEY